METPHNLKILIVDDHPVYRKSLRTLLENQAFTDRIYEAGNGLECLNFLAVKRVDLILMDIRMPGMNGIQTTHRVKVLFPEIKVLGISLNAAREERDAMEKAGALGFVPKESSFGLLITAIVTIMNGDRFFPSPLECLT